ncbi:hypothetical protein [Mesorhizobium sp. WSM3860]|uniref:hypothetical protein n=1 Tax=Mesorhizobium sp. WSM3860 TaxID=2029403 RepID=UPI000BAE7728|nr:hypothetical protein [Mesorhizobium sp. WSM3860]PBC04750.1 hypothetical protein CK220_06945 [Mesorhizobium sp. WSM3860]
MDHADGPTDELSAFERNVGMPLSAALNGEKGSGPAVDTGRRAAGTTLRQCFKRQLRKIENRSMEHAAD